MKKILSVALCLVLIFSTLPVFAISASAETSTKPLYGTGLEVSSTNPTTPDKWTLSNSKCVATTGITLHANRADSLNKATYNEPFVLTEGFELTFNAYTEGTRNIAGEPGKNFLGAKVGNITAALRVVNTKDALVMVIAVDGTVVATSDVIYDKNDPIWTRDEAAANIEYFLGNYYMSNSAFVLSYDPATKTVTYSLNVGSTEEGTLTYVDAADAIDLSEAVLEFQSQGAWNAHAYYNSIKLVGATCTEHVFDNACDTDCNECGAIRTVKHTYDDNKDVCCNICGAVREFCEQLTETWAPESFVAEDWMDSAGKFDDGKFLIVSGNGTYTVWTAKSYDMSEGFKFKGTLKMKNGYGNYFGEWCSAYFGTEDENLELRIRNDWISGEKDNTYTAYLLYKGEEIASSDLTILPNGEYEVTYKDGKVAVSLGGVALKWTTAAGEATAVDVAGADLTYAKLGLRLSGNYCPNGREWSVISIGPWCGENNHIYDNACDTDCNVCGDTREVTHQYTNACDRDCNVCGIVRSVPDHVYSNACDRDCNICGTFRRAPHDYDNACDDTCDNCGTERDVPDHVYDNVCDGICNVCGFVRVHYTHQYDNACDDECNKCGAGRSVPDHVYDNACDTDCNECGDIREVLDHVYSGVCDSDCNVCGYVRQVNDHKYSNVCDIDCNVCGFIRTVPHVFTDECDGECDLCYDTRKTPHKYDGACDNECNLCGKKRSVPDHTFDNNCDADCNVCGFVREGVGHSYDDYTDADCNKCGSVRDMSNIIGGVCGDNVTWELDTTIGILKLIGTGATYNYVNVGNVNPFIEHRANIKSIIIGDGITRLGNRLFRGLSQVESVRFGKDITTMGYEVFYGCGKLAKVELNEGLTHLGALAFYGCKSLTQITIPSTVTNLENRAFKGAGLTSIVVPDTVTKMGYEVFMNCANLAEVDFTEGVSMLNHRTFENCTSLKTFYFTRNMCRIRSRAFYGCTALESITFEDANEMWGSSNGQEAKIASNVFEGCNSTLQLIAEDGTHVEKYASRFGFTFVAK